MNTAAGLATPRMNECVHIRSADMMLMGMFSGQLQSQPGSCKESREIIEESNVKERNIVYVSVSVGH
jgi:hypothetical protein